MTDDGPRIEWIDESTVAVDGTRFLVTERQQVYSSEVSTSERFLVVKSPEYLRSCLERFRETRPRNLLELGVWQGGSVVFWNLALRPERHLAIDLYDRDVKPLQTFEATRSGPGRLDVRFGVDQADKVSLDVELNRTFGAELVDIVIDDASHSYFESRQSFESLLGRVRAGGLYVIENWAWAHMRHQPADVTGFDRERPALSNLIVEILMLCAARSGVVDEVLIDPYSVRVRRGAATIEGDFRLSDHYSNRGLPFRPLL